MDQGSKATTLKQFSVFNEKNFFNPTHTQTQAVGGRKVAGILT